MTSAFLVFANLWLLTRLVCLFRDEAARGPVWTLKTVVELTALAVLYPMGGVSLGIAACLVALNFSGYRLERQAGRKDLRRLLLGAVGLAIWSVGFSPRMGLDFRPELMEWLGRLENWTALAAVLQTLGGERGQWVLFGLLLSANEANLVIRAVFDRLELKPRTPADAKAGGTLDVGEFNRGRVIGLLERALLYGFVLQGQFAAIGFILAAKAFTRFRELDNRTFAEYVLIGTLMSAGLALLIGGVVKWLLPV
jgi:hypothetical protein